MFETITYERKPADDPLQKVKSAAIKALKNSLVEIDYPAGMTAGNWPSRRSKIDKLNSDTLDAIQKRAGVYGLLILNRRKQQWILQYIGMTSAKGSRQRLRSHVVWRNKSTRSGKYTASQFDQIQDAVVRGSSVAISFVEIKPSSLRHYVEDELLTHFSPIWNIHGVPSQTNKHRSLCTWDVEP